DVIEDLPVATQWSAHKLALSAPASPDDDDADAGIPSVFDRTLSQGGSSAVSPLLTVEWKIAPQPIVLVSMGSFSDSRGLSTPSPSRPIKPPLHLSNDPFSTQICGSLSKSHSNIP